MIVPALFPRFSYRDLGTGGQALDDDCIVMVKQDGRVVFVDMAGLIRPPEKVCIIAVQFCAVRFGQVYG